ncbi:MAG: hypothetical protein LBG29_09550 [Synergistaceae bacterium]|jgi:hypothetical protein|nr:hypothetical protein [Synergistaceae bacterium]
MSLKWNAPIFVNNTFAITFEYKKNIRRYANIIEDSLKSDTSLQGGGYNVPFITPIPDEIDPNAPRLIFNSLHGFSQIVFNQTGVTLNVSYSEDYMPVDATELRMKYLQERINVLHNILGEIECIVLFSGIISRVLILTVGDENELQNYLPTLIPEKYKGEDCSLYESMFRKTEILSDEYFNIFQVSSYRETPPWQNPFEVPRDSALKSPKRGIEIVHDINDRYSYNKDSNYFTNSAASNEMFSISGELIKQFLDHVERS